MDRRGNDKGVNCQSRYKPMKAQPFDALSSMNVVLVAVALVFLSSVSFAQGYELAPAAEWVTPVSAPLSSTSRKLNNGNGSAFLLVDRQWRKSEGNLDAYAHFVMQALNTSGVEHSSHIEIDFDPEFESLTLHQITIHRDGQQLGRLDRSQISLIQREERLDSRIYDGTKTLNIFVDDVRVGDSIEYSFSIRGSNPVFAGHFAASLPLRWQVPVERVFYRVAWSADEPLQIRNYLTPIEPQITAAKTHTDYVWSAEKVAELIPDPDLPHWHDPFPNVHVSDMAGWNEVVEWAIPLYASTASSPAEEAVIARILENSKTPAQRVNAALQFVQEDVRYLGIEMGPRSHRPRAPEDVIEQRFGDCKDKSRLLVSLLHRLGIDSVPALVHTNSGMQVKRGLPTPTAFNHVIVQAHFDGKHYWLDPTLTHQSGDIESLVQPDYDYALTVADNSKDLVPTSSASIRLHSKTVRETFDIRDAIEKPATYDVETLFEQTYAESQREQLAGTNLSQLQDTYLNYYARYFPSIRVTQDLSVVDDKRLNKLKLVEHYAIPEVWAKNGADPRYLSIDFVPFLISDHVKDTSSLIRTMPLATTHPVRYQQTTQILVPPDSYFENEHHEITDKAFRFSKDVSFANGTLKLVYTYTSLQDHVMPEDVQDYSDNIRAALRLAQYQIDIPRTAAKAENAGLDADDANWPVIAIVLISLFSTIALSYRYVYLYDPASKPIDEQDERLVGIAGWLILSGLGIVLSPLQIANDSRELLDIFSYTHWSIVGDRFGPILQSLILAEFVFNVVLVVIGVFVAVLFFSQRNTLPRFFIAYTLGALVVTVADYFAVRLLADGVVNLEPQDTVAMVRQGVFTLVWIAYYLRSRRVQATFTRRLVGSV